MVQANWRTADGTDSGDAAAAAARGLGLLWMVQGLSAASPGHRRRRGALSLHSGLHGLGVPLLRQVVCKQNKNNHVNRALICGGVRCGARPSLF